jgi:ABC-type enterochelin transport system substrate-binding protein
MKKIFLALAAAVLLMACGSDNSPVGKLVDLLDEGVSFLITGGEPGDEFEAKFDALFEENADYVLTSSDKKKITGKFSDLANTAMKAALKSGEIPEGMEDHVKNQLKETIGEMEEKIAGVEKFGELKKIFD